MRARLTARFLALATLAACATSYRPATLRLPEPLPDDAFERVLAVMRERYPRLALTDRAEFRLQSHWLPFDRGEVPGERRATVFRDRDSLAAIVEVRFLVPDLFGPPAWTAVGGDRALENQLVDALREALR